MGPYVLYSCISSGAFVQQVQEVVCDSKPRALLCHSEGKGKNLIKSPQQP